MKHILLPTDFSNNAWNAIFTVLKLYTDVSCVFYVLNTYEPNIKNIMGNKSSVRLGMIYESMRQESQKGLEQVLDYMKKHHLNPNHSFETISRKNDLVSAVNDLVKEKDLDLIVMGTKGATGSKKIFIGSNTVKILKGVRKCAVMAVPSSFSIQALKTIVLPTEYGHFFPRRGFTAMIELAKLWHSKILIFHVAQEFNLNENQQVNKKVLKIRLKDLDYSFHKVTIKSTVAKAVSNYCEKNMADMVVLIHYEHTFMEKLTQEPVVSKMAFNAKMPILVLPDIN